MGLSIIRQIRVGLVIQGDLDEKQIYNPRKIKAMWRAINEDVKKSYEQIVEEHNDWTLQELDRAGRIGRLLGEVQLRTVRHSGAKYNEICRLVMEEGLTPTAAARTAGGVEPSLARTWLNDAGFGQAERIKARQAAVLRHTEAGKTKDGIAALLKTSLSTVEDDLRVLKKDAKNAVAIAKIKPSRPKPSSKKPIPQGSGNGSDK